MAIAQVYAFRDEASEAFKWIEIAKEKDDPD
jgi:hypothetical protein